ncbi:MAG: LD-carboxypeptidase [Deltaproteobacteria bacterium]|nr:LD-carboxypeptidase [Deltaproteobacteria bacterium]
MKPLVQGSRLAVIAPAGPFPPRDFNEGVRRLEKHFQVSVDPRCHARQGYLAGPDSERAEALLAALRDPSHQALIAARGGYGAMRILEHLRDVLPGEISSHPIPLVGFSDLTAFLLAWWKMGVKGVHGPMVAALGRAQGSLSSVVGALLGEEAKPWEGLRVWAPGKAEGPAVGGNLTLLASLVGTRWMPRLRGSVLFLEDIDERPYRLDRKLTMLRMHRALEGVRGVVLGQFTRCEPGLDGVTAEQALREGLSSQGVPVYAGAPFGHGDVNLAWVHGARVSLRDGAVRFREGLGE